MKGILHHDPGDQSISVEAEVSLAALQEYLAADNQMLAIEASPERTLTVGEVIAQGRESCCALRHGSLREQILGLSVRLPDGRICRSGGRVAKNVTGYDLGRLHCGGEERFGQLTEVSLRLRPRSPSEGTWIFPVDDLEEAWRLGMKLRDLPHRLSGLVIDYRENALGKNWIVALRVDGHPKTLQRLNARLGEEAQGERLDAKAARSLWHQIADLDFAWPQHLIRRCAAREMRSLIPDICRYVEASPTRATHFDFALPGLRLGQANRDSDFPAWAQRRTDSARQDLEARLQRVFVPRATRSTADEIGP